MAAVITAIGSVLAGAAVGSVPSGYLIGIARGVDVRAVGSGNIGFTNVFRTLGWWGIPVLVADVTKGLLPVAVSPALGLLGPAVGLGAVLGHTFTPWLSFRGGKGVATALGASTLLCPRSLAAGMAVFAVILIAFGFVSLSSMSLAVVLAPFTALLYPGDGTLLGCTAIVGAIILVKHLPNIRRLASGAEPRFGPWTRIFRRGR